MLEKKRRKPMGFYDHGEEKKIHNRKKSAGRNFLADRNKPNEMDSRKYMKKKRNLWERAGEGILTWGMTKATKQKKKLRRKNGKNSKSWRRGNSSLYIIRRVLKRHA